MLVACVVHDQIEDELHATLVEPISQYVHIGNVSVCRFNYSVVTDVVSLISQQRKNDESLGGKAHCSHFHRRIGISMWVTLSQTSREKRTYHVVLGSLKNRRQPDDIDAQILQIVNP